jgi:PAS/PAC sensor hybrid histidine kinase
MTKILLVEDDKSLQEIYGVRLGSEGYQMLIAGDGEEALNVALKEKPDLILSDVMMPKISGFDMLDILRSTPEIKDTKVIIMTALSSEDQRERGEQLGADIYLVKSQVGIEDVVQAVKDLLEGRVHIPQQDAFAEAIDNTSTPTNNDAIMTPDAPVANDINADQPISPAPQFQPAVNPVVNATPQFSNSEVDEAIQTNGESLHRTAPTPSTPSTDININPQYRQPTSLRDLIPEREQTND